MSSETRQRVVEYLLGEMPVDDLIQFRRDSSGMDLVYLEDPFARTDYGIKVAIKDVPDTPGTNNLLKNPFMRDWPGTLPVGWNEVNFPTITKQTAAPYTAFGGASIKVETADSGDGVISDAVPISVSTEHPWVRS